ncbi:MAG: hypothetical protein PVH40_08320 [Gemmatimonadales bacterium]|jgi:ABC-type transport system involved in multi-copper enzyme maturation permease subunit
MGRAIASVIVGYVVMALIVFLTFSLAYLAMGADGAYEPGTYDVSILWIVCAFVLSFIAALVGGYVAAAIAKSGRPILVLIGLVIVLGALSAIMTGSGAADLPTVRDVDPSVFEAMQYSWQPSWVAWLTPVVGALGVFFGSAWRMQARASSSS